MWDVPAGTHRVFAIYENRTQHFPAGGAYPGAIEEARLIDHLDRRGAEAFLEQEFVGMDRSGRRLSAAGGVR